MANELPKDPAAKPLEPEVVAVPKDDLKELIRRLDQQSEDIKALKQDNIMLRAVADVSRVDAFERRNAKGELIRTAIMRKIGIGDEAKIVKAWRVGNNSSYVDELGKPFSKQTILVQYLDDTWSKEMDYAIFNKQTTFTEPLDIVKRSEDDEGNQYATLRFADGETLEINIAFLN